MGFGIFLFTLAVNTAAAWFIQRPGYMDAYYYFGGAKRLAQGYTSYTDVGSVVSILTHQAFPVLGDVGEYVLSAALIGWMLWEWWLARGDSPPPSTLHPSRLDWAVAVTLVVTLLVSPRTGTTSQPMLYPVLLMLFARFGNARPAWGIGHVVLTLAVTAIGLWWLFVITVEGRIEQPPVFLPLPLGLAGALLLARRGQG